MSEARASYRQTRAGGRRGRGLLREENHRVGVGGQGNDRWLGTAKGGKV